MPILFWVKNCKTLSTGTSHAIRCIHSNIIPRMRTKTWMNERASGGTSRNWCECKVRKGNSWKKEQEICLNFKVLNIIIHASVFPLIQKRRGGVIGGNWGKECTTDSICKLIDIKHVLVFPLCSDINECERNTDTCHVHAMCANTEGSYECMCDIGYEGDGRNCEGTVMCNNKLLVSFH